MKNALVFAVLLFTGPLTAQPSAPAAGIQSASVVLDKGWQSPLSGNTVSIKELASLLSPFFQPSDNTASSPIEIYGGVTYLMPLPLALQKLGITQKLTAKIKVACPGFPKDSFSYYACSGSFEGDYDQMNIVVDGADQVVSIQLVCNKPKQHVAESYGFGYGTNESSWHTYNFIENKSKAMSTIRVCHNVQFYMKNWGTSWRVYEPKIDVKSQPLPLVRIESEAVSMKRGSTSPHSGKLMETVRWYVPKPLAELILYCARKNG